ncbi:hypothetical protein Kallioja_00011 [Pseudomonas phage vB_PpuP-Kallioja]
MVQRIKFHASFPEPERYGLMKVTEVVFKLGLGPCGKHVHNLAYEVTDNLLTITQRATELDSVGHWFKRVEIKTFVYKLSDIHGRIEVVK